MRICTALRAAGIEVWLDQNELRGGDIWDASIRQQIKSCGLFVPVISENTRARAEGYFRLEWKLAVDRSHLMAADRPFLVPVVIDAIRDADARVPDRFREAHWTRLPGGEPTAAFIARLTQLLSADRAISAHTPPTPTQTDRPIGEAPSPADARSTLIGRDRELKVFNATYNQMLSGRRQLLLMSGEAGIGKTRCTEAFAEIAEGRGTLVLWGRCHEEEGAPPYWPWVQVLRAYIETRSLDEVRASMGPLAKYIAALVPELLESTAAGTAIADAIEDASPARFRVFDALRQFFQRVTQRTPVALAFEDLHWADAPSLALMEFLNEHLPRSQLIIIGTYRDTHPSAKTALTRTLGGLKRGADVQHIHLSRLSETAIGTMAERLCSTKLLGSVVRAIHRQTDGNPLFATELIRVLIDEGEGEALSVLPAKIPAGVQETIGRRLMRLPDDCNAMLCTAAVLGRQFTAGEIAQVMDAETPRVLTELEPALQAAIIEANPDVPGGYQFSHALIRETIYEELPVVERLRRHARCAAALVNIHSGDLNPVLTRVAHHYYESVALGHAQEVVTYALLAAESAARIYAFEEAILLYDRVIKTLEGAGMTHDARLARAYVLKATALKQMGQMAQSVDVLLEAVNRTQMLGSAELLVDLLTLVTSWSRNWQHQYFVPLLERVLEVLPPGDSPSRAKALATLVFANRTSRDRQAIDQRLDEALGMAGRVGDATVQCFCYEFASVCLRGYPENLQRRLHVGREFIEIARSTGRADLLADAYNWQVLNLFESGRINELGPLFQDYGSQSVAAFGIHQYQLAAHRITLALLRGEWTNLEAQIEHLLDLGMKTRRDDADGVYGAQMFALNRDLGRLHEMAPQIKEIAASTEQRMWAPGLMLICAEIGLLSEARPIFARLVADNYAAISRDDMYMTCLVYCAQTCCLLADKQEAARLYQLLFPYQDQVANHPTAVCFGAVHLYLGMLARTADNSAAALEHFGKALDANRAMHAWPVLARSQFHYGVFLLSRPSAPERALGHERLREAAHLARQFGMARLAFDAETVMEESCKCEATLPGLSEGAKTRPDNAGH